MSMNTTFIGLDVSKASIAVGIAPGDPKEAVRYFGAIKPDAESLRRLCRKLGRSGTELYFCFEAGPFGYQLQRRLEGWGHRCDVIAPSLIPSRPGDRVKTDRRDALSLASLLRAGQLTAIWVPDETHEAIRSLVRLRRLAGSDVARAKQQILSFCLTHERVYGAGRSYWTKTHRRWLVEQKFEHGALSFVYSELLDRLERAEAMLVRARANLKEALEPWALYPVVHALQALRGFDWENAAMMVAEIGDFTRFPTPRQLMAYVGLVPSEYSSGGKHKRGEITKAGNTLVRRALVEAAWTYRFPARQSYKIRERSKDLPDPIRTKAWEAQTRLCARMRHLARQGKHANTVLAAIARELIGFVWAIARMVQPKMT